MVFAQQLEVGGTQVNAIELAAALRDLHGYDVVFFATPGPMVKLVEEKGLRFLPAPDPRFFPSPARIRALRDAVRRERPDLIQVWDWWQCIDAYYGVYLPMRIPMIVTDMMMDITRILPKRLPTTFGTPQVLDSARAAGRRPVELILPPVDVRLNAPGAVDPRPFRERYGIDDGDITIVTVSRLSESLKGESLSRTIDAVRTLGHDFPLRFVIVGDGVARARLERKADQVNRELGRVAVTLAGELLDPRPAYSAADVVIGMGGSALRGMAFGKAVVVVGEEGFSALFTPETAQLFYHQGMYGRGERSIDNGGLVGDIRWLCEHSDQLPALGQFSRQFVLHHFALETVTARLAEFCRSAVTDMNSLPIAIVDGLRTAAVYFRERRFLAHARLERQIRTSRDEWTILRTSIT